MNKYDKTFEEVAKNAVFYLKDINIRDFLNKFRKRGNPQRAIKNMINAWYSKCSLNYPSLESVKHEFNEDQIKELKMLFQNIREEYSAWNYVKMYYTIFFSISAMLRAIDVKTSGGHRKIIRTFNHLFFTRNFSQFFCHPFDIYIEQGNLKGDIEDECSKRIAEALKESVEARESLNKVSLIDFFYWWREIINYIELYSFVKTRKKKFRLFLRYNIQRIIFLFNLQAEVFLIKCYGYRRIRDEFNRFSNHLKKLKLIPFPITVRFSIYEQYFSDEAGYF